MLDKIKKVGVIVLIAILFSFFSFSLVETVVENPDYDDFCGKEFRIEGPMAAKAGENCTKIDGPSAEFEDDCQEREGFVQYKYDINGCAESFSCNTCSAEWEKASENFRMWTFVIVSILGVAAMLVGLYLKPKNEVMEWAMAGFIIGGIANVLFGTMIYYGDLSRFLRPVVLFIEIILILLVAVKTQMKKKK